MSSSLGRSCPGLTTALVRQALISWQETIPLGFRLCSCNRRLTIYPTWQELLSLALS